MEGLCEEGRHLRDEEGSAGYECDEADYEMGLCGRHLRDDDYEAGDNCDEADYEMGLCKEGRHLEKSYVDHEYEYNELDDKTGLGGEGRRLTEGDRRLRRAESGNYELEEAERDDCTEEDGCEHEESEDEGERRLAGGSVDVERDGKCRGRGCRRLNDS